MPRQYQVAKIDEATCIGCTKCLSVCPVDAIIGANKQMHVVLAEFCIGCDLCLPLCPVDSISLIQVAIENRQLTFAKKRYQARKSRLNQIEAQKAEIDDQTLFNMNDIIAASIKKAELKKNQLDSITWEYHE